MSKAFDTINIHTLIRKLLQTNIPDTIIKFIANYIKGRKAYPTYINHTSRQCQFKTGVPQGGVPLPTLFNIYNSDLSPPSAPVLSNPFCVFYISLFYIWIKCWLVSHYLWKLTRLQLYTGMYKKTYYYWINSHKLLYTSL